MNIEKNNHADLVTVIVPVYNVEKYLVRCVNSILRQTYMNIEILLIDDGSTDKSGEICDSFTDERVKSFHQINRGVSVARNNGLDHATGEWIMFVDSDDFIHSDMVEILLGLCKTFGSLVSRCGAVRGTDNLFPEEIVSEKVRKWEFHELYLASNRNYRGCVWGALFHRSLFRGLRFPIGRAITEDEYTAFFAMYQAGYVIITNRHMYYYYMSPVSALRAHKEHASFDFVDTYEDILGFLAERKEHELINSVKKELCIRAMMNYIGAVKEKMPDNDLQRLIEIFSKYYAEIDLSKIPKREKWALALFRNMPHMMAIFENYLNIIHNAKLSREKG